MVPCRIETIREQFPVKVKRNGAMPDKKPYANSFLSS